MNAKNFKLCRLYEVKKTDVHSQIEEKKEAKSEEKKKEGTDEDRALFGDDLVANKAIMMLQMAEAGESVTEAFARAEADAGSDPMVLQMLREAHEKSRGQTN